MGSQRARVLVALAAVLVAVGLFIVLPGDDDSTTTTTSEVPTIEVEDGQPVGGIQELTFTAGDHIRIDVKSDTAAEVHLHGYNVGEDVEAGGEVSFDLPADIEGVFEVELEETATQIAEVTVEP